MTVYCYLDDVKDEDGGALYFARARPGAVRVRVRKGLAAIFYSALEDGTLDRTAAHGDAPLRPGAEAWVLALRVYDRPRPLARRVILPAVLWLPFGGAPRPSAGGRRRGALGAGGVALRAARRGARCRGMRSATGAGDRPSYLVDAALWALAALLFNGASSARRGRLPRLQRSMSRERVFRGVFNSDVRERLL